MIPALLCLVIAITDGDTIKARCGEPGHYEEVKIRLAEIDAPEKKQNYGQRSKEALSLLCFSQQATIKPLNLDRYGRTVARVECKGKDANLELVRQGMAWAFTKYLTDPAIKVAETEAKAAKRGLWADAEPVAPWEWRKSTSKYTQHRY